MRQIRAFGTSRAWAISSLIFAIATLAHAQSYPSKPVTVVVPFPAGGPTDTLARILSDRMKDALGQPVLVENPSGAGGTIGTGRVARAAADGYTTILGHWQTHVVNGATYEKLPFDVVKDFEPISLVADCPMALVGRVSFPAKDVKELIAWLKANPGKATVGIAGTGGAGDVVGTYFQKNTATNFTFVPYRGGAPMMQDLIAGQIDLAFLMATTSAAQIRTGRLKGYAVMADNRWPAISETPTLDEAGLPGLHASYWHGWWAPKGTAKPIVAKLNAALVAVLADPAVRGRLAEVGWRTWPPEKQTPEALASFQKTEIEKWWPIIKAAGIKSE